MIQLVTDSSADLPKELLDKYNISVVPLTINIDGKEYLEGVDLMPQEFYEKMCNGKELPKTSQPSPAAFADFFKTLSGKGPILCLTISSGLSGTYQSACVGRDMSGQDVTVFDTLAGSLGHGLQLIEARKLAIQGLPIDKIVEFLDELRKRSNILILLDTLENIVKGGRLSKFQGSIAKILDIKVLLEGIEGKVEIIEKIRGKRRFLMRTIDIIGERKRDFSDTVFGITHINNLKDAEILRDEIIKRYKPKDIIINYMGATMGTYAGKGGIIVSFY
ncbi:DegV family protein [Sporosalibacterium faouarense]|jgi:DegV family protein with EDD domain|uniref:DegV family protein n=1 Tax=Sporosalibacterium faouarense TaxID=516123 RepID=UPI00192BBB27|nr:DegV family protein [Sporosalibacterium faouarense]